MSSDIHPESGSRLPPVRRRELDELGRGLYDALVMRSGTKSLAGVRGPGGLNLYSPRAAQHLNALSHYLRHESGIAPQVREIAILTTAREMDNQFEWTAHEPVALKEGVSAEVVEVIKRRGSTQGLAETEATVIELGRQIFDKKKVDSELFARGRKLFGDRRLVELVMLMGNYAAVAALLTACDTQLAPDQKPLLPPR
jgi:4-carboxymuconolactone decarboxylase